MVATMIQHMHKQCCSNPSTIIIIIYIYWKPHTCKYDIIRALNASFYIKLKSHVSYVTRI